MCIYLCVCPPANHTHTTEIIPPPPQTTTPKKQQPIHPGSIGATALQLDAWRGILSALAAEGDATVPPHAPPPPELGYVRLRPDVRGELVVVLVGGALSREGDVGAGAALVQVGV